MVEVSAGGAIYAFIYGQGLMQSHEGVFNWTKLGEPWEQEFILHLAIDPGNPLRMFSATGDGRILASKDGGATWAALGQ